MPELVGKCVFYIEDNPGNRAIVQMILERAGVNVACDRWGGADVIDKLKARLPIDLILVDLMLPENVTGYAVFEAIQREPALAHIPVAILSAADPTLELNRARAAGFAGYISKPIHLVNFPQQINRLIAGEKLWAAET